MILLLCQKLTDMGVLTEVDTVDDLMLILECRRRTVYDLLKKKEFRYIKLGGSGYRISRRSFDEWLDRQSC